MRKLSKTLLALLLVVMMLAGGFPFANFITKAEAAGAGFHYEITDDLNTYDEYLIVNTSSNGTGYATKPASGSSSANSYTTTSVPVTISGGRIEGDDSLVSAEWKFMQANSQWKFNGSNVYYNNSTVPTSYMAYNPATGAFLWNPAYETSDYTIGTCVTPVQDDYNGSTIAVFDFASSITADYTGSETILRGATNGNGYQAPYQNANRGFWGPYMAVHTVSGDGYFTINVKRSTLPVSTWRYLVYTWHRGTTAPIPLNKKVGIFAGSTNATGFSGSHDYSNYTKTGNWYSDPWNLYNDISGGVWQSGNAECLRIDPCNESGDANTIMFVDSVLLAKTERGAEILSGYRREVAWHRDGGLMPSVEYPFCQIMPSHLGSNMWFFRFYENRKTSGSNLGVASADYFLHPSTSNNSSATYSKDIAYTYLYKKVYDDSCTWEIVDHLEDGGVYIIANSDSGSANFLAVNDPNGSAVMVLNSANTRTITNGKLVEGTTQMIDRPRWQWTAVKAGVDASGNDVFWLQNNSTYGYSAGDVSPVGNHRIFLADRGVATVAGSGVDEGVYAGSSTEAAPMQMSMANAAECGNSGANYGIVSYLWRYDNSSHKLYATHAKKDTSIPTATDYYGYSSNNLVRNNSSSQIYFLKKTYHTHNWTYTSNGNGQNATHTKTCTCGSVTEQHTWDDGTVSPAADCTHPGTRTYYCTAPGCTGTYTETIPELGHNPGTAVQENVVAATCTTGGSYNEVVYCTRCGTEISRTQRTTAVLGHDWGSWTSISDTQHSRTCNRNSGHTETENHTWNDGEVTRAATCSLAGIMTYTCTKCGKTRTEEIPVIAHTPAAAVEENRVEPTCTVDGSYNSVIYCSVCGAKISTTPVTIPATGHTPATAVEEDRVEPTCTVDGSYNSVVYCSVCGVKISTTPVTIPATGHTPAAAVEEDRVEPTCTVDGSYNSVVYCSVCGAKLSTTPVAIPATGHTAGNPAEENRVEADCTTPGSYDIVTRCTVCNAIITSEHHVIEALGHDWGSWVTDIEATCTANGHRYRECSRCDAVDEETIQSNGSHNMVAANPSWSSASGLGDNKTRQICTRCGYFEETLVASATGNGTSSSNDPTNQTAYKYYYTDTVLPGHEYLIVNADHGSAKLLYDNNGAQAAADVSITGNGEGSYISISEPSNNAYVWNALSAGNNTVYLENKNTGNFLKAFDADAGEVIHNNVGIEPTLTNANELIFNSNGYTNAAGYKLGYKSSYQVTPGGGNAVYANPSGEIYSFETYSNFKYEETRGCEIPSSGNYTISFDIAFGSSSAEAVIGRGKFWEGVYEPMTIKWNSFTMTIGGTPVTASVNYDKYGQFDSNNLPYGNHWLHYEIIYYNGYLTVKVDGVTLNEFNGIAYSSGASVGAFGGLAGSGIKYIDNLTIVSDSGTYTAVTGDNSGDMDLDDLSGTTTRNRPVGTTYTNKFVASTSEPSNRVYFYEKRPVAEQMTVYQRATSVESGKTYILVDKNIPAYDNAQAHELGANGTPANTTVYEDGISYTPYVTGVAANEFVAMAKGSTTYIFNNASGTFLTTSGVVNSLSDSCYLTVTTTAMGGTGASNIPTTVVTVTINGTKYYLYEKTPITEIDTDLVTDFAVIDFGRGFEADINTIRGNDDWIDRVGITLNGIFDSIGAINTGNKFYKTEQASYVNLISHTNKGTYTYDSNNHKITFEPAANAKYEDVDTIYYGVTVKNLGAYMYAPLSIIPATMVYYEDTAIEDGGVVQYTNSSLATTGGEHDGWGKWTTVGTANTIKYLFDDVKANGTYGYNRGNATYYNYSAGSAKMVRLGAENMDMTEECSPTVSFTFKGTGFAVYSATGNTTDIIFVEVIDTATDDVVVNDMVDNYYGYEYKNDKWTPVSTGSTDPAMYQIPVLDYNNLSNGYSEYSVTIFISHSSWFDHDGAGYTDFYFDGFRVYNPLGTDVATYYPTAAAAYQKDKEYAPKFINLRENLEGDGSATGVKYLDSKVASSPKRGTDIVSTSYEDGLGDGVGAKNDIMLTGNAAITFALTSNSVPSKIALGAKVSQGTTAGTLTITGAGGTKTITVSSGTDMFYDITGVVGWTSGTTSGTIMITKGNGDVVSLTDIKISYANASLPQAVTFAAPNMRTAWEELADIYGVEVIEGDVAGDGTINLKDLKLIKHYLAGKADLSKYDIQAADVDGNGLVNFADLKLLKARIAA